MFVVIIFGLTDFQEHTVQLAITAGFCRPWEGVFVLVTRCWRGPNYRIKIFYVDGRMSDSVGEKGVWTSTAGRRDRRS